MPELHRLATTIETWWPQIHAFLTTGITNAGSEGTNRVIKTVARDAYGFRNPENSGYAPAPPPPTATADTSTPLNFEEPSSARACTGSGR
ncbi:transposase [Micromonospora sp. NPDC050695]|uniref:transposase n=1 Tax=Micromonospora sp. NPDC050695 TaxID=3154938 RepID=UPI0033E6D290